MIQKRVPPPQPTGYIFFLYSEVQWQRTLEWFSIILLFLLTSLIDYFIFLSRWESFSIRQYQPVHKDLLKFEKHPRVCRLWWPVLWEKVIRKLSETYTASGTQEAFIVTVCTTGWQWLATGCGSSERLLTSHLVKGGDGNWCVLEAYGIT